MKWFDEVVLLLACLIDANHGGTLCMSTVATPAIKLGLALEFFGIELRLWKEIGESEWGATLRENHNTLQTRFKEENLTMAKLHLLAEARKRVVNRSGNAELPGCDAFLNSWKPINLTKA
jgi:hypothetical protein